MYQKHVQDDRPDEAVLRAVANGDREAFGVLVERYQQVAFRTGYLLLRDSAAAEDIAQDAFLRAYGGLPRFRIGEPFRPWLLRIVTNLALNELRGRGRRHGLWARLRRQPAAFADAPERAIEARERTDSLVDAINELPLDDRMVLYLRYFLELSEAEIAVAIAKRPGTVKSRLHRASTRLRAVIDQRYPALQSPSTGVGGAHDG